MVTGNSKSEIRNLQSAIRTRWHRLIEMSPQEIGYRLYKELAFRLDKWYANRLNAEICDEDLIESFGLEWINLQPELSLQNLRRYLRDTVGPRFYFNPAHQEEYVQLVKQRFPQWIERARAQADRICQHRFQLLGFDEIHLGDQIDWQRSPETGRRWPQRHWIDIDLHPPEAAGDPKVIWELNRHQHLLWLGLAYCYTQDESYVNEYLHQVESWIDQNPYQMGINWASSLEIAFRAINWFWALCLFINSPRLHNESLLRILKSLVQHLEAISRNPSVYTSPNTHLIGEAYALYLGGLLLAEHKAAARWRKFGARILSTEMQKQIGKDGAHKEQSAYYHCYTVEFYLLAAILAHRCSAFNRFGKESGNEFVDEFGLTRACEFLMHICQPGGELTAFGDEDGGRVLMFGTTNYRYPADLLATAAVFFGRGDFKYCAGEFPEATLWLLGRKSLDRFDTLAATPPRQASVRFSDSGHVALRSDWSRSSNYLLFHCPKKTHLPGHSHADCLSFELASGGRGRLIDSGTYRYNDNIDARNYFRGTSAHNSVRIDHLDQSSPGGAFKWQRQAGARLLKTIFSPVADYVCGEHDGYLALPNPCLHRRAILFARPDYFIIWDEFTGNGEHDYESFFHFGDAQIEQIKSGWLHATYTDGLKLLVAPLADGIIFADIVPISKNGIGGWYSRAYGNRDPSLSLRLHLRGPTPATMLTVLFPYRDQAPGVESFPLGLPNSLCMRVTKAETEDVVICSLTGGEFHQIFGRVAFAGKLLLLRANAGMARWAIAFGARMIQYGSQQILSNPVTIPQFIWEGDK